MIQNRRAYQLIHCHTRSRLLAGAAAVCGAACGHADLGLYHLLHRGGAPLPDSTQADRAALAALCPKPAAEETCPLLPPQDPAVTLSVIVPVYNGEATIGPCLDSILQQETSCTVQLIVVDSDSTDGTAAVLERYRALPGVLLCNCSAPRSAAAPERFELPGMPWGKVYRRELFAQVRFPAYYTCFEDAIIHFLVFRLAKTVASVPEVVYLWRKNPKGLTATSQHRPAAVQSYWIMEQLAVQDAALGLPHDALYRCSLTLQLSAFCYATVSGLPPETQQAVFRLCCALYAKALPQEGALPRRARWGARALRQQDFGLWCRYGRRFQLL